MNASGTPKEELLPELPTLNLKIEKGVAFVEIMHPPMNLLDSKLLRDLLHFSRWVEQADAVKVIVFRSADPEFFIAHFDLNILIEYADQPTNIDTGRNNPLNKLCERFRLMPKLSIAQIEGRARGGGSEFALGLDLRFAAIGRAVLGQPEAVLHIPPGGGASQRLPRLIGRARALEVLLGCEDFDALLAERYGYVNRALPEGEIGSFVERLAYRVASYPTPVVAAIKEAIDHPAAGLAEGLHLEQALYERVGHEPWARDRMRWALSQGAQRREVEMGRFLGLLKE